MRVLKNNKWIIILIIFSVLLTLGAAYYIKMFTSNYLLIDAKKIDITKRDLIDIKKTINDESQLQRKMILLSLFLQSDIQPEYIKSVPEHILSKSVEYSMSEIDVLLDTKGNSFSLAYDIYTSYSDQSTYLIVNSEKSKILK